MLSWNYSFQRHVVCRATHRPLDGHGCQSHSICGGGTPWDVQWSNLLLPRRTEPGFCNDTAFSPIWGLTMKHEANIKRKQQVNRCKEEVPYQVPVYLLDLTIDHKREREIPIQAMLLEPYKDSVFSCILLCDIPDDQGSPIHVVSGALLCCHPTILQPDGKENHWD